MDDPVDAVAIAMWRQRRTASKLQQAKQEMQDAMAELEEASSLFVAEKQQVANTYMGLIRAWYGLRDGTSTMDTVERARAERLAAITALDDVACRALNQQLKDCVGAAELLEEATMKNLAAMQRKSAALVGESVAQDALPVALARTLAHSHTRTHRVSICVRV
jgi:hypothetical protein